MEYRKLLENLRRTRIEKGLSQADFAKILNKTKQYVYLLEKGLTPLKMEDYFLICKALRISPRELIEGDFVNEEYNTTTKQLEKLSERDFLLMKHLLVLMETPTEYL